MAQSAVPAFRSALKAKLVARGGLSNVQILLAITAAPEPEWIWIARTVGKQRVASLRGGNNPREETFDQYVYIRVIKSAIEDETGASARAFALMGEIEDELRADPSVGGVIRTAAIADYEFDDWEDGEQRGSDLLLRLGCSKRI